jgi:hypothetical protein
MNSTSPTRMDIGVGERGRNRTFNLLFGSQTLKMNDFNEFPTIYECMVRRFEADLGRVVTQVVTKFLEATDRFGSGTTGMNRVKDWTRTAILLLPESNHKRQHARW